jgi:hypothetical protein
VQLARHGRFRLCPLRVVTALFLQGAYDAMVLVFEISEVLIAIGQCLLVLVTRLGQTDFL